MEKKGKIIFFAILLLLVFVVIGIYKFSLIPSVYAVSTASTISNATIAISIGFTFSGNLSEGIQFGTLTINTNDNNASGNYDNNANTSYQIQMDTANNANADTCIKDNANLTSGANTIPNTGYTYDANSTINGANMNDPAGSIAINTSFVKFDSTSLAADVNQSIQFYLDIPDGQAVGDYNNTIDFKIVETGQAC